MKFVQIGIVTVAGMVLFLVGANTLLGISESADAELKKPTTSSIVPSINKPKVAKLSIATIFKKPVKVGRVDNRKTSNDDSVPSVSNTKKHESSEWQSETEHKESRTLTQIDRLLSWPKSSR